MKNCDNFAVVQNLLIFIPLPRNFRHFEHHTAEFCPLPLWEKGEREVDLSRSTLMCALPSHLQSISFGWIAPELLDCLHLQIF